MTAAAAAEAPPCWSRAACEETPARPLRIGSLCTGYGGLDMAVLGVFGGELVWVADNEPGAAQIIAHRHPGVKNLGDITLVDWAKVEPVDVLVAGFPCQDLSYAGLGAGIIEGNRSGLWFTLALAIRVLRPRLVVLENVAAIVGRRPGLDVVAASLAALGFDAEWDCVRAADVGAPHIRDRWFALAWPKDGGADAENTDREPWGQRGEPAPGETGGGRAWADAGRPDRAFPDGSSRSAADPAMRGRDERDDAGHPGPAGPRDAAAGDHRGGHSHVAGIGGAGHGPARGRADAVDAAVGGGTARVTEPAPDPRGHDANRPDIGTGQPGPGGEPGPGSQTGGGGAGDVADPLSAGWQGPGPAQPGRGAGTGVGGAADTGIAPDRPDTGTAHEGPVGERPGRAVRPGGRGGLSADTSRRRVQRRGDPRIVAGAERTGTGEGLQRERDGQAADGGRPGVGGLADGAGYRLGRATWERRLDADTDSGGRGPGQPGLPAGESDAVRCPGCGDLIDAHDDGGFCAGDCGGNCPDPRWGRPDGGWNSFKDDADPATVRDYALRMSGAAKARRSAADTEDDEPERAGTLPGDRAGDTRPRPGPGDRGPAADPERGRRARRPPQPQRGPVGGTPAGWPSARDSGVQWGKFAPAIERWELLTGRAAPAPTDMGRTGPRLSPRFVEWLMGLPPGWVTDVPGLSRSAQLKALGNGVVPQQAVAAIYLLAARIRETWDLAA